jgi:hypothetical protein
VGLSDAVLVAASPGWRDNRVAQKPEQLRDGDQDQPGVQVGGLLGKLAIFFHGETVQNWSICAQKAYCDLPGARRKELAIGPYTPSNISRAM